MGQIPFVNLLKERGCYVIAVSVKGNYPGFEIADKCYYVGIPRWRSYLRK